MVVGFVQEEREGEEKGERGGGGWLGDQKEEEAEWDDK